MATELKLFVYVIGLHGSFSIRIQSSETVGDLQKAILKENSNQLANIDARQLTLHKVSLDDGGTLAHKAAQSIGAQNELIPSFEVSDYFATQPPEEKVSIVVKLPEEFQKDERSAKRRRISDHDMWNKTMEDKAIEILSQIAALSDDPLEYSNPQNVIELPFPSLCPVPARFAASPSFFYVGREMFSDIWEIWSTIKDQVTRRRAIYIYGSMGYGKSHILAALACLLIRTGHRIVYLPDCRAMLGEPLSYVQRALRLALWKREDTEDLKEVLECKSFEELITICEPIENLCFIIDQENALHPEPSTTDSVSNKDKAELQKCLRRICFMKISITSASANHKSARYMRQKQTDDVKIALLGGLSNVEMTHWWLRHAKHFEGFTAADKQRVEDLTGNIPLLLGPFLNDGASTLAKLEPGIWQHQTLASVTTHVREFAQNAKNEKTFKTDYVPLMRHCLTNQITSWSDVDLDHRYFYLEQPYNRARYTCGLARQAMMEFLREFGEASIFLDLDWHQAIRTFKNNPSAVGFIIEAVVISIISTRGLAGHRIAPTKITTFPNDVVSIDPHASAFYVPLRFNFKAIDALYVEISSSERRAHLTAIQITVAKQHRDSEAAFFSDWQKWSENLQDYDITWSFLWIVPNERGQKEMLEKLVTLRSGVKMASPVYYSDWVSLDQVDRDLANVYKDISAEVSWVHK